MPNTWTFTAGLSVALVLGGCEPVTGGAPGKPVPEMAVVRDPTGLSEDQLATLLDRAERMQSAVRSGTLPLPVSGHPLDGLAEGEIQMLFAAARLRPDLYLPVPTGAHGPR